MGISVHLHSTSGQTIDRKELEKRLTEAGAIPYPEDPAYDTSGNFMLPGVMGSLELESEKSIRNGVWASVRLSWASTIKSWQHLLDIAERVNGRIYDSMSDQYLTYETLDEVREGYYGSVGTDMLGKTGKKEESKKKKEQGKNENNKYSNKDKELSPLEFAAEILKSMKDVEVDIASRLPGGVSVSGKTIKGDSEDKEEWEDTDFSGKNKDR